MQQPRFHLIFDLDHCRPEALATPSVIEEFIRTTIAAINMKIIAGPIVCEGVPENPGLSGFAVLDFSHASVHTFTRTDEAMIDIFSCKPYDRDLARSMCLKYFATEATQVRAKEVYWDEPSA